MRGHSASKTRVNALVTRASITRVHLRLSVMDCRVKPGNDGEATVHQRAWSGGLRLERAHRVLQEHPALSVRLAFAPEPAVQPVEHEIDHRRRVERQELRDQEAADDGDAERPAQLGAWPG